MELRVLSNGSHSPARMTRNDVMAGKLIMLCRLKQDEGWQHCSAEHQGRAGQGRAGPTACSITGGYIGIG